MPKPWQLLRRAGAPEDEKGVGPAAPDPPEEITGVLDTYRIPANGNPDSSAQIFVVDEDGMGRYLVRPPRLDPGEKAALDLLRANLLDSIPAEAKGEPLEVVSDYVTRASDELGIGAVVDLSHDKLLYFLMREFSGFWEVDPLVNDDNLEEISVCRFDRPVRVLHRDFSQYMFMETDVVYPSEQRLQAFVRRLAQLGGTTISLAQPSLEVTLHGPADRRVTATLGDEISRPGSTYAIRKQKESPITLAQLAAPERARWPPAGAQPASRPQHPYDEVHSHKTLSVLMAAYFWLLLERTTNVLIAGESVDHDEPVLVREGGRIGLAKIGELVDRRFVANEQGRVPVKGIEVVCFDPRTLETRWAPLQYVYRHRHSDPLLNFKLDAGREVTVTKEHSVFTLRKGKLQCVKANEIERGDFVVAPRGVPGNEKSKVVADLLKELAGVDGIFMYEVPRQAFERKEGPRPASWKDWKAGRRLPIKYANLLQEDEKKTVVLGYKGSRVRLGPTLEVDEDLARLLGYYAAEGWSHLESRTQYTTGLSFGHEDELLISDSITVLSKKFGINARLKSKGNSRLVMFSHRLLGGLFARWVGTRASRKGVPHVIFSSPSSVRKAFISAWSAGGYDGSVSRSLSNGIAYLLLMENCVSTTTSRWTRPNTPVSGREIHPLHPPPEARFPAHEELVSGKYHSIRGWGEPHVPTSQLPNPLSEMQARSYPSYRTLSPTLPHRLQNRLNRASSKGEGDRGFSRFYAQNIQARQEELEPMSSLQEKFSFLEVVGVEEVRPTSEYVYDVSVPECENFLAGFGGVFCHNTNSGKTTLMNAILALANPRCKIVTAEDVLEISLPDHLHWQRLKTRSFRAGLSPTSGRYEYGLPELLKLALRFSPTILSLG